jgi:hypothetical protein
MQIRGVQAISGIKFTNLYNEVLGYSNVMYDIKNATKNGVIYPSYDASIFEVRYPDEDIKVRLSGF